MSWPTVQRPVVAHGQAALGEPTHTAVLGLDETRFGRPRWQHGPGGWSRTDPWETGFVDLAGGQGRLVQADGRTTLRLASPVFDRRRQPRSRIVVRARAGSSVKLARAHASVRQRQRRLRTATAPPSHRPAGPAAGSASTPCPTSTAANSPDNDNLWRILYIDWCSVRNTKHVKPIQLQNDQQPRPPSYGLQHEDHLAEAGRPCRSRQDAQEPVQVVAVPQNRHYVRLARAIKRYSIV